MLHCRIFRATCLATTLGNKLHEPLHSVIYLATAQIIAKQAAAIVEETRIKFLQRFQPCFSALHSEHSHLQLVSQFLFLTTPNLYYCELYNVTHSFAINITRTSCAKRYLVEYHLKPAAYRRKQLSKLPGKAVCSAVSSRVRRSFPENFATRDGEENICHVWYFWPRKADSSPCTVNMWIGLSHINKLANEIGLFAHVISKLKMGKSEWNHAEEIMFVSYFCYEGGNRGKDCFKLLSIQSMKLSECIAVFRI